MSTYSGRVWDNDPEVTPNYVFAWYGEDPMEYRAHNTLIRARVELSVEEPLGRHKVTIYNHECKEMCVSFTGSRRQAMEVAQAQVRALVEKLKMNYTKVFRVLSFVSDPPITTEDCRAFWRCGSSFITVYNASAGIDIPLTQIKRMEIEE